MDVTKLQLRLNIVEKENEKIILGILNIKYSDKLKKLKMEDIKKLQGNESILVIRRKNER